MLLNERRSDSAWNFIYIQLHLALMFLTESEDICSSYWGGNNLPVHKVEDSLKQHPCTQVLQNHTMENLEEQ